MAKNYYYKGWHIHFGFRYDEHDLIMHWGLPGPNGPFSKKKVDAYKRKMKIGEYKER